MDEAPLEYFANPTTTIDNACRDSLRIANTNGLSVWFNFNGTRVEVTPGMRLSDAVDQYFSKHQTPQPHTMNETEKLHARIASLEAEIASHFKHRAAIEAAEAYKAYAAAHAQDIANEADDLLAISGRNPDYFTFTAEYTRLRNEADRLRKEVQP